MARNRKNKVTAVPVAERHSPPADAAPVRQALSSRRPYSVLVGVLCLLVIGGVGWFVLYPQVNASYHWRQAEHAVLDHDFGAAQAHLQRCLEAWPQSGETHFVMARTCRRAGDLAGARTHLDEARRLGWVKELTDLESLLLQAQSGAVRPVESRLRGYLTQGHRDAALIVEALVIGWLEGNFVEDAYRLTSVWLEEHADDWAVRFWHGRVLEAGLRYDLAAEEYARVLERKPGYAAAHLRRAEVLLWKGRYKEALPHFEAYLRHDAHHAAALLGLARCQRVLGSPAETRATLTRLLADHPEDAGGCRLRGQLALDEGHAEEALAWLQRARALGPPDMENCQALATTLRHLQRVDEALAYERQGQQIKKDMQRVEELIKEINTHTQDVSLRYEAGTTLVRLGREQEGARWLASVLLLDPGNQPARKALADCVEKLGDPQLAAYYRRVVETGK
jgi:tetratricopeptide (TPR) repeat protein